MMSMVSMTMVSMTMMSMTMVSMTMSMVPMPVMMVVVAPIPVPIGVGIPTVVDMDQGRRLGDRLRERFCEPRRRDSRSGRDASGKETGRKPDRCRKARKFQHFNLLGDAIP